MIPDNQGRRTTSRARYLPVLGCIFFVGCMPRAQRSYRLFLCRTARDIGTLRGLGVDVPARFLVMCHDSPDFILEGSQCDPAEVGSKTAARFREEFCAEAHESLRLEHGEAAPEERERLLRESHFWIYDQGVHFDAPLADTDWDGYMCVAFIVDKRNQVLCGFMTFHKEKLSKLLRVR